jgi:hypothetical protein
MIIILLVQTSCKSEIFQEKSLGERKVCKLYEEQPYKVNIFVERSG